MYIVKFKLIYNVLVSGVEQSGLVIYMCSFSDSFTFTGCYEILNIVPCGMQ